MHTTELIREIDRLLQAGELSYRRIADHLGVSRGTVSAIANGRRGLHGREALEIFAADSDVAAGTMPAMWTPRLFALHYLPSARPQAASAGPADIGGTESTNRT